MEIKASLNYFRMSPRKVRLVANLVRGMEANRARAELYFLRKRAARSLLKLLDSALANAKNNFELKPERMNKLYIKSIEVNEGPTFKRFRAVAMGAAHPINKRTSHIKIVLDEIAEGETSSEAQEKKQQAKTSKSKQKSPQSPSSDTKKTQGLAKPQKSKTASKDNSRKGKTKKSQTKTSQSKSKVASKAKSKQKVNNSSN